MGQFKALEESNVKVNVNYPVILKPVASVEGEKLDIRICYSEDELERALAELKDKKYNRVLVQRYLKKRKEYVLAGSVSRTLKTATVVSNVRQWPPAMGCGSFSEFVTDPEVMDFAENILGILQQIGYEGGVDVEFFRDDSGNYYLNEINWRSSGRNFVSLYTGVHSIWLYYCSVTGEPAYGEQMNKKNGYTMNEATDLRHVVFAGLPFSKWWSDRRRTNSFAIWWRGDMRPVIKEYMMLLLKLFIKRKSG